MLMSIISSPVLDAKIERSEIGMTPVLLKEHVELAGHRSYASATSAATSDRRRTSVVA